MKNKGITLVALVITIIILLILAGISISALTNQGLFAQANNAKRESEIASIKEQIALDIYEKQLEPPLGSITEEQLETILGKYGTVNKEDGTIVGITTGKGYEILLKDIYEDETVAESVPDGAIVTPVNDITTWLKTAEISKKYSYTTIEQVIADTTCIESLMNNENAMKYLARSTEFVDAICTSETAMTYLGQSAYVDDTVLNSDVWLETICNSSHFSKIFTDLIPTMTDYESEIGKVTTNSEYNQYGYLWLSWYAFTKREEKGWTTGSNPGNPPYWVKFEFTTVPNSVNLFRLFSTGNGERGYDGLQVKLLGSNDDDIYTEITSITIPENGYISQYVTSNMFKSKYKYYKFTIDQGTSWYDGLFFYLYGR